MVIAFFDDEIDKSTTQWQKALGKFLGQEFPIEFIQKEMKLCWNLDGELQVFPSSKGLLLFHHLFVEAKVNILEQGHWSLAGQLLDLESWWPKF